MKLLGILTLTGLALSGIMFAAAPPINSDKDEVVQHIRKVSWMIQMEKGTGSGVMFTRKEGKDNIHFVWTAGHNIKSHQYTEVRIHPKTKQLFVTVAYPDVEVMQAEVEDGRVIGHHYYYAQVIRYSEHGFGQDLALLRLRKKNLTDACVNFNAAVPKVGINIWHVGSARGLGAPSALSFGNTSSIGLIRQNNIVYDQYTIPVSRGCSGGGIFLTKNGDCIGLVSGGSMNEGESNTSISYARPARKIIEYAERVKCKWAVDQKVKLPKDSEIFETPIEDIPIKIPEITIVKE